MPDLDAIRAALDDDVVIDIVTVGARSGEPRETEIWFLNIGDRTVITGSPGRRDWFANLLAHPDFTFRLKQSVQAELPARARHITDPDDRRAVLGDVAARWYQEKADLEELVADSPLVEVTFTGWAAPLNR